MDNKLYDLLNVMNNVMSNVMVVRNGMAKVDQDLLEMVDGVISSIMVVQNRVIGGGQTPTPISATLGYCIPEGMGEHKLYQELTKVMNCDRASSLVIILIDEMHDNKLSYLKLDEYLFHAFDWHETSQGTLFWCNISTAIDECKV